MVYTDRQRELIRAKVKEYYDLHHFGARTISWAGLCDAILNDTRKHVRFEPLRQWVTGFVAKDRNQPLRPRPEEMEAIVEFLMLPGIDMLSPEELEGLEPPYRFLLSFLEYLGSEERSRTLSLPWAEGVYEAWHQVEDPDEIEEKWIKTTLTLEVDNNRHTVRATEVWEIHFRGQNENMVFSGSRPSEGWGIVTSEGDIFLFMRTQPHAPDAHNYYYLPIASNSQYLALLRHEPLQSRSNTSHTFEELTEAMKGRTILLHFTKVAELTGNKGE